MKEIEDIILAYDLAIKQNKQTALATVVHVQGSSYRRPGARMLITEDGQLTGTISGGCLEGDALRKALLVMTQQKPMLVTYDTTDEDDAKLGVGLGCNGIIQVLIEPAITEFPLNPLELLKRIVQKRQKAVLVTLFSLQNRKGLQPGTCLLQLEGNEVLSNTSDSQIHTDLLNEIEKAFSNQASSVKMYDRFNDDLTAFIEFIKPSVSLVIAGAGNDAIPLMEMASILGWQTTIVDGRANYATKERFPLAHNIVVSKPAEAASKIVIDEQTVFVLMTHNYNYDFAMLRLLMKLDTVYIGMLGPRKKLDRMLEELSEEGIHYTDKQLLKLYGPVGLDIGAEAAEEIALSIASEIKAVLSNRQGYPLRDRPDTIHTELPLQTSPPPALQVNKL